VHVIICIIGHPLQKGTGESAQLEGIWPTENLTRLLIARWVNEAADEYNLDEEQIARARGNALKRWPTFLKKNRAELQPVINEFIEMRLEMEPPSKERVQAWATKADAALNLFKTEFDGAIDDFRGVLNPLQKAKFEAEVLEFGVGMMAAQAKLKQWQGGEFEERAFWDPPSSERRRRRAEREAKRRAEKGEEEVKPEPVDQVASELEAWDRYVEQFINIYKLDDAQQATARSCLKELKERAVAYRDRNRDVIARLENRIENHSGSKEELAEIKKQLVETYGPIDEMFQELKRRLDGIPTEQQRAAVARPDEKEDEEPSP
jgi:hypothetical protein